MAINDDSEADAVSDSTVTQLRGPDPQSGNLDFDVVYQTQWWPMLRLAQGLVDDVAAAEDVVQDAFAGLYGSDLRDAGAAVGYLRVAVVNRARSALRRRRTARAWLRPQVAETAPAADQSSLRAAETHAVREALSRLPRRQRKVLTLRFIADLTDAEIADAIGTSPGNVRSAASRGLSTLRATIGDTL